ncbi:MAG: hypothetical protein WKF84_03370 [Pyrinomonadaceae bacterium]
MIAYAEKYDIPITATHAKPYSHGPQLDASSSHMKAAFFEDPRAEPLPADIFQMTKAPEQARSLRRNTFERWRLSKASR